MTAPKPQEKLQTYEIEPYITIARNADNRVLSQREVVKRRHSLAERLVAEFELSLI